MNVDIARFSGAACLLRHDERMVFEVRKPHRWERSADGQVEIGIGCVGGSIEPGESPVEALRREAEEEVGCAIDVTPARETVCVSRTDVEVRTDLEIEGVVPAMVWDVQDPTFEVGTLVAVFHATAQSDPQPVDLPAIVLDGPQLVTRIGLDGLPVADTLDTGAEIRENVPIPRDATFLLANTLRRLQQVQRFDRALYDRLAHPEGRDAL